MAEGSRGDGAGFAAWLDGRPRWAVLLTCLVVLFLRSHDQFLHPQLRAEDGSVFFIDAREDGLAALTESYQGYHHALCRLTALAASPADPVWAPWIYNGVALLVTLAIAGYALSRRIPLPGRPLLALAVVGAPHQGYMFLHLTDVQYFLAAGLMLLLVSDDPRTRRAAVLDIVFLVTAATTGPFVIFMTPLFLARALARRSRHAVTLLVLAVAFSVLQGLDLEPRRGGTLDLGDPAWLEVVGLRIAGLLFLGVDLAREVPPAALAAASAALLAGLAGVAAWQRRTGVLVILAAGVAIFLATGLAYRGAPEILTRLPNDRYAYPTAVAILWCLVALAASSGRAANPARVLLLLACLGTATRFQMTPLRDTGWERTSRYLSRPFACDIPINPLGWTIPHRPETAGLTTAPDALDRVIAEAFVTRPAAIRPPPRALLTFFEGRSLMETPPGCELEFAVPRGSRRFRIEFGIRLKSPVPVVGEGLDFAAAWIASDGRRTNVTSMPVLLPADPRAIGLGSFDLPLPPDEDGRLVLTATPRPGNRGLWFALWTGARLESAADQRGR